MTPTVAVKVYGVVMTSSPGPTSNASRARCRPAVAELTARACAPPPMNEANSFSNRRVFGPVVSQPERKVSTTSAISSSPMSGRANGRKLFIAVSKHQIPNLYCLSPARDFGEFCQPDARADSNEQIAGAERLITVRVEDHLAFERRDGDDHHVVLRADSGILDLFAFEQRAFGDADLLEVEVQRFGHRRQFDKVRDGGRKRGLRHP